MKLNLELTRRCNIRCRHCLRGGDYSYVEQKQHVLATIDETFDLRRLYDEHAKVVTE